MLEVAATTDDARSASPHAVADGAGRDRARFVVLLLLFFGTGACGLIYQQLWLRELSLVFGVTVQAVSTVLAAFFGGLALGGYLAGRWSARTKRPIAWYGMLEIGVGVLAVLTPAGARRRRRCLRVVRQERHRLAGGAHVRALAVSFVVLIVPATLMGASLPLVVSSSMLRTGRLGGRVGMLYAVNTAGAVVGTIVSGFWLIGLWGLNRTYPRGGADQRLCRCLRSRRRPPVGPDRCHRCNRGGRVAGPDGRIGRRGSRPGRRRLVLAVFGVSGFVTLALEVVWFRQLILFLESSTYAFTVMLATVLVGIAVGSAVASPFLRRGG